MNKNKPFIITLIILLLILGLLAVIPVLKKRVLQKSVSPNILLITQPVLSFSGIVEKVEGNTVTITQKVMEQSQITLPLAAVNASPFPTPKSITVTYRVLVTDKTQISQPATFINYLLKTVTPFPVAKLTIKDVKVGQSVTVNSQTDLRTLAGSTFEAATVNLPPITSMLSGKIVGLEENTLTLKAFIPVTSGPMGAGNEKEFTITITQDTEISRMPAIAPAAPGETPQTAKAEKLAPSDLKKDMQVTVYTAEDVTTSQNLTALRIEPMILVVMPTLVVPSPMASPSP